MLGWIDRKIDTAFGYGPTGLFSSSFSGVEQLAARRVHNPQVAGSIPAPATKRRGLRAVRDFFLMALIVILPERD